MFCEKCGAPNADNASFCSNCGRNLNGTPVVPIESADPYIPAAPKKKSAIKILLPIIAIAAVIAIVMLVFTGSSETAVAKKFMDAQIKGDANALVELLPDQLMAAFSEEWEQTRREIIRDLSDDMAEDLAYLDENVGKWEVSYEIIGKEKVTGSELRTLKSDYLDYDMEITDAQIVHAKWTLESDEIDDIDEISIYAVKIDGKWYLDLFYSEWIYWFA